MLSLTCETVVPLKEPVYVYLVDKQFARAVPFEAFFMTLESESADVDELPAIVVVAVFLQVQVLSFLQEAKLKAAIAKANKVIFFMLYFLSFGKCNVLISLN